MKDVNHISARLLRAALVSIALWAVAAGWAAAPARARAEGLPAVEKRPAADWIKRFDTPGVPRDMPRDEIQDGRYYLHVDRQIKVSDGAPTEYYRRYCIYLTNETGLEKSSQISISFDPSYEKLELNQLRIIRRGEVIAKLPAAEIQLLRREEQLESMLYDGRYSAHVIVDDVRVGDILEYAYTIKGENPIYQGIFSDWLSVSWRIPVQQLDFILHWTKSRPFYHVSHKTDFVLDRRETADDIVYSLFRRGLKGYRGNSQTPTWYRTYGAIQMSQIRGWSEVVDWALPLYAVAYEDQPEVAQLARSLTEGLETDAQRVMAVLAYLQKHVRYLGIEMGINSHRPSPPDETLKRRFGDCKDKTVAMVALLSALGIEARPVLVNTDGIRYEDDIHPAIDAFDHVIVLVDLPQRSYWLDPTRGFQGHDIDLVFQPDYGYGLVIAPGQSALTLMPSNIHLVGYKIDEYFDLPKDMRSAVTYAVTSAYSGLDAENLRRQVAEDGIRELQGQYLDFYRKYYPGIRSTSPIQVQDDESRNELKIIEHYQIDDFWEKDDDTGEWTADFYANVIESYLRKPKQRRRSEPFWISHPENIEQNIHIQLGESWDLEEYQFTENNPYFHFTAKAEYHDADHALDLFYRYQSQQDTVPPDATTTYIKAVDRAKDNLDYYLFQTDDAPPADSGSVVPEHGRPEYGLLLLAVLLTAAAIYGVTEWLRDMRKLESSSPVAYYPVSLFKFAVMSMVTLGVYPLYWFYKQWAYIRAREDSAIMPVMRAVLLPLWYYSFYKELRADSIRRFGRSHLPAAPMAVVLLLVYLSLIALCARPVPDVAAFLPAVLSFLCLLPLVNYIRFINRNDAGAMELNSRFRPRHVLLMGAFTLLVAHALAVGLHWMPSENVIKGSQLPDTSIRFMQRQGLINDDEDLIYFYSDAFWSHRDDGNGVTRELVFSYWHDEETGKLMVRTARYPDIDSISVSGEQSGGGTAVIVIKPKSGTDFQLYAPTRKNMHIKMIREIESRLARFQQDDEEKPSKGDR